MALSAIKNQQIVDAALAEFVAHGFHGARMDAIAERAQVSKRTVYKHFASKDALFDQMIALMRTEFRSAVPAAYDPAQPIAKQLRKIGEAEGKLFTSRPFMKMVRLLVTEAGRDRSLAAHFPDDEADSGALAEFLADAHRHGALVVNDPKSAASQFRDLLKGRAFWPALIGQRTVSQDDMAEIVEEALTTFLCRYAVTVVCRADSSEPILARQVESKGQ